jgi:hypothetical protein
MQVLLGQMDFSETFRFSGPKPVYSPDGRFLAMAVEYRLVLRDVETLQVRPGQIRYTPKEC